jgi:hypothetical protein
MLARNEGIPLSTRCRSVRATKMRKGNVWAPNSMRTCSIRARQAGARTRMAHNSVTAGEYTSSVRWVTDVTGCMGHKAAGAPPPALSTPRCLTENSGTDDATSRMNEGGMSYSWVKWNCCRDGRLKATSSAIRSFSETIRHCRLSPLKSNRARFDTEQRIDETSG